MVLLLRKVQNVFRTVASCSPLSTRAASTYEGDGKTSATVLNKDLDFLMISAYSPLGFRLNSGIRIVGPAVLFPRTVLSWNIAGVSDVNDASLSIFTLLCPKIDILVFGYGEAMSLPRDVELRLLEFSKRSKIGLEVLPTEKAVSTFNYLNHERRLVAGAFIPPAKVQIYDDADLAGKEVRQKLLNED